MQKTPNADSSILGAVLYLSISIYFYILGLNVFFELYLKIYKIPNGIFEIAYLLLGYGLYYFNNKYFNNKKRVLFILEKFKNENSKSNIIGSALVYSITIFSIVFFMLMAYFSDK